MKKITKFMLVAVCMCCISLNTTANSELKKSLTVNQLKDKIKGAWAGQTIGVTFGGCTEFVYLGRYIPDDVKIPWYEGYVAELMDKTPGLFDDIYMDLTFVDILEKYGMNAPVKKFAQAFANAEYPLWHANQAARYNILHNIKKSGYWKNNPHADDIDYQIESDFAGIMSPGMPNTASKISDRIGHIMCYGDGWYGGVFVGAMYALAYVSDDIEFIVNEALKTIPQESLFYQCIQDAIKWCRKYPNEWKRTWKDLQDKYADEKGCPDGVHSPFDIDAKLNAAYIVMGLLYGDGDFTKTMEVSTRAGQDSDCNPSSAGGILGTMIGYDKIPTYWKNGLKNAEDKKFQYTRLSLNDLYSISYNHAIEMIKKNGGNVNGDVINLHVQQPKAVRYEECFEGIYPSENVGFGKKITKSETFDFEGVGFVLRGQVKKIDKDKADDVLKAKLYIDGKLVEKASFPTAFHSRRLELFWKYDLKDGKHTVTVTVDPQDVNAEMNTWQYIVYKEEKQ